jgi:hypothetical protein
MAQPDDEVAIVDGASPRDPRARRDGFRAHIVEDTLLRPGAQRRDWKATLLSDDARRMSLAAATDVQLHAS